MAISFPERRSLCRRDCHAALAMTVWAKWVRLSLIDYRLDRQDENTILRRPLPTRGRFVIANDQTAPR